MSMKEKVFIKNKITEYGGRIPKGLCQQAPNYYHLFYIRMQQLQIHWVKANYIRYIYQLVIFQRGVATNQTTLGYLPILEAVSSIEKKSSTYKNLVRETFHKSLRHLLELIILLEDGVDLSVNNETIWFYPRVSTIISDWPETASFCLVYKSPNSTFPCHFCLVKKDDLANINLSFNDVVPRTHNEMRRYLENNTPNSASIESVPNFFWNLP